MDSRRRVVPEVQSCNVYTTRSENNTEGTEAFTVQKAILDCCLLYDIESVMKCVHTGELESLHALFLKYAPKFSRQGIIARLHLATIDHNTNTR